MRDLRFAFRALWNSPLVSLVAILSLALGIGANTAIFSLFDQTLARPLPVPDAEQLVNITSNGPKPGSQSTNNAGGMESIFSYPMLRDLERVQQVFTGVAGHRSAGGNLAFAGQTTSGSLMLVSGSYFPVLGLRPALGRLFTVDDDKTPGGHRVVVLSHSYWTEKFNRDPGILGQALTVNGLPMTILGVAPEGFRGTTLTLDPEVFVPLSMRAELTPGWEGLDRRNNYWIYVFARLRPGVSREQAEAALQGPFLSIIRDVELAQNRGLSDKAKERFRNQKLSLVPGAKGQSNFGGEARTPIIILFTITGFVLLIACANIANLLLARAANRAKEFSVRLSLGATRWQLMRQLLAESLLLSLAAGAAGLLVAYGTTQLILSFLPADITSIFSASFQPPVYAFSFCLSVLAGFLFGLFPAMHATKQDLAAAMKDQAGNVSSSRAATFFRKSLVTAQIAISLLLLVSAGLFLKSLVQIMKVDLGIVTTQVVGFGLSPSLNRYSPERAKVLYASLEEKLRAVPGVQHAVTVMVPLIAGNNWGTDVDVEGFPKGPDIDNNSRLNTVGDGYFRMMGIPILAGREFQLSDTASAPPVGVVNEAFQRKFSPKGSILGKRVRAGGPKDPGFEVVGVVKDSKYSSVKDPVPPLFFLPYRQSPGFSDGYVYVKSTLATEATVAQIRRIVRELDPALPIEELKTLESQVTENISTDRMISTMAVAFALLATVLAAVGLYGVLAFTFARRTREIGIRLAVGAQPGAIRNLVFRDVAWMAGIGALLGLPAAYALGRLAESELFEMKAGDPVVFLGSLAMVLLVVFLAGYLPARRAMRVDPMTALRYE
ncbi:MAG: ABC transporter permease [Bryobacter sp.]